MITEDKPSFKGAKMSESINRAFMYGESVFTTMRMIRGEIQDWGFHFDRLKQGVEFVYGPFTEAGEWAILLKNCLEDRLENESGDRIIRLTIYLEGTRGVLRSSLVSINDLQIHLAASAFEATRFEGKHLKLRTCKASEKPQWWPSFLKAGNYLETILSQKMNLKDDDDDLLFLSESGTVLESSIANIFILRHNTLYTAPAGPQVLAGVMRRKILSCAHEVFESCKESETTLSQLKKADAVFGSNSVRGLFLIERIDDYQFVFSQDVLEKFEALRSRVLR